MVGASRAGPAGAMIKAQFATGPVSKIKWNRAFCRSSSFSIFAKEIWCQKSVSRSVKSVYAKITGKSPKMSGLSNNIPKVCVNFISLVIRSGRAKGGFGPMKNPGARDIKPRRDIKMPGLVRCPGPQTGPCQHCAKRSLNTGFASHTRRLSLTRPDVWSKISFFLERKNLRNVCGSHFCQFKIILRFS